MYVEVDSRRTRSTMRQHFPNRKQLALQAAESAMRERQLAGYKPWDSVCIYDLVAERYGIEVHFMNLPSMEGMYIRKSLEPLILISSLRPPGRQAYTCAHELGHHIFGHGVRIDEHLLETSSKNTFEPEEFLADCFAGFMLMPRTAVSKAFAVRGWSLDSCTPIQCYTVADWLGVGYATLINHMNTTLKLISPSQAKELSGLSPKQIRSSYLGPNVSEELVIVDEHWAEKAIDIQVGDLIFLPANVIGEGKCIQFYQHAMEGILYCGATPGTGRLYNPGTGWSSFVRVSRRDYAGRSIFRHLEESDDE
jgi:Zn-dependent peptidase ImmA (M78 family)